MVPAQDHVNFWKAHREPLKSTEIRLSSTTTTGGSNGKACMKLSPLCAGSCMVESLGSDWYGNAADEFIVYLEGFHNAFQRPIWVTEGPCQNFPRLNGDMLMTRNAPMSTSCSFFMSSRLTWIKL
ncbi:unnamed protein product, partial [Rhizoctonia solani]